MEGKCFLPKPTEELLNITFKIPSFFYNRRNEYIQAFVEYVEYYEGVEVPGHAIVAMLASDYFDYMKCRILWWRKQLPIDHEYFNMEGISARRFRDIK